MWAVKNALETFQQELSDKCVGIQIDNKTVVAYLQKEGVGGGGGDPLPAAVTSGLQDPVVVSQSPHLVAPCLRERDGQHHCRFPVSEQRDTMVPVSGSGGQNLRPVRDTGDRFLRVSCDSTAPEVHDVGPGGQPGLRDRRPEPAVGVSVPVCLPSPDAGTHSGEQTSG